MSMNCVLPPELDDKQLLAWLDDSRAHPDTDQHLEKCTYCRQKANVLDRFQKHLTTRLYRSTCPSPIQLGEYHLRNLSASQRLVMAQHLRECPRCAQEITQLEEFLSEFTPPTSVLESVKVLVAKLVGGENETGSFRAMPALRGETKNLPIFEAEGLVISLDVQSVPNGEIIIQGQVAADDQDRWTGATVELKQRYLSRVRTFLDDLGAFTFEAMDPGSTQITLISPEGTVIQTETVFISI